MKYSKILTITAIVASIAMTTTAFASGMDGVPGTTAKKPNAIAKGDFRSKGDFRGNRDPKENEDFAKEQDPLKMLETRKTNLQTLLNAGKITQEQGTTEIAKIDEQIKEFNEFNALDLDQKKAKLTANFKTSLDTQVKEENLTQKRANEMLKAYTDKLANWDVKGNYKLGMPMGKDGGFREQGEFKEKGAFAKEQDQVLMLELRKLDVQTMLKEGTIAQNQATAEIAKMDEQIKEVKVFNALTLEGKKAKLTSDFKTNLDKQVTNGRLAQTKADEMLKAQTDKLAAWDGTGHPMLGMHSGKDDDFRGKVFKK